MKNIAQQILRLLIYMVLLTPTMLLAQPICQIQHFSIYNGLVQRTVSDIVQDSKGFIWFSTWNGLNRYDGYTFKNYKAYPGDGCTLTSNRIYSISGYKSSILEAHIILIINTLYFSFSIFIF